MRSLILLLFMVASFGYADAQVPQKPLIEHFTQASCGPCASQNPTLKSRLDAYGTANYVRISHQVSWPGYDPMHDDYPAGPNNRRSYYSITAVPNTSLNGGAAGNSGTVVTSSTLATAGSQMTPYQLDVDHTWVSSDTLAINIKVKNTTTSTVTSADRIRVAMLEDEVTYPTAPGSNGETAFEYVMRAMYNPTTGALSTTGATIDSIPANDSIVYNFNLTGAAIPSYLRDLNEVSFAAFLQNNSTKVVYQSGKSQKSQVPNALAATASSSSTTGAGFCNYTFTPIVNFTNNSATAVTTVTAEYTVNGGTPVSQTFTGNLTQGQSAAINFPTGALASGASTVAYAITDVNNGATVGTRGAMTIDDEDYSKLVTPATAVSFAYDFQTTYPPNAVIDNPANKLLYRVSSASFGGTGNIGGFGNSTIAFAFDFWPGAFQSGSASLVFGTFDMSDTTMDYNLKFDHAFAQWNGSNDQVQVLISTDCGNTWDTPVWDKAGALLATAPDFANNNDRFIPTATQWDSNTVDLTASYRGESSVTIAFKGTSNYGNPAYIDDINLLRTATAPVITGIKNTKEVAQAALNIMPNPVRNQMMVQFDLPETAEVNMTIYNALGQQVQNVTTGTFEGTNTIQVNTQELAAGVYLLNLASDKGLVTKRFTVEK